MKKIFFLLWVGCVCIPSFSQQIEYKVNTLTGAIDTLSIRGDERNMNWILADDGSQYPWIKEQYGWGLGYFTEVKGGDSTKREWEIPSKIEQNGKEITYHAGPISIQVKRNLKMNDLVEEYTFTNNGDAETLLSDIGINTPFNDNYPDAAICMKARTNAHIWAGENAAYVDAVHQSGQAPHLGLVVTKGSIVSYEIKERGIKKGGSNTRGVIILNPENIKLNPRESYTLSWRIFSDKGTDDFFAHVLDAGSVVAKSDKYVYEKGDVANLHFESLKLLKNPRLYQNGKEIPLTRKGNFYNASVKIEQTGDIRFELIYDSGKRTHISCLGVSSEKELISKRVNFIIDHQQMNDPADGRYGAYMVYDNELNKIFLNDKPSVSPVDRDEGAERVGMGVLLALYYQRTKDSKVKESLLKYANFVRNKLQNDEYKVWSSIDHKKRNRAYNYPWIADFYFQMFKVTGSKQFLKDGYGTIRSMFRQFGHSFYAIDMPVQLSQKLLRANQMQTEADSLLEDFRKVGNVYLKNGTHYPHSEVNYEQSIVAPSIITLLQLYIVTGEIKYLKGAEIQMPLLEAFGGPQPSYHLNEIAIRHWDDYWFGKREMWGDVFPHYWSTLSAVAYNLFAQCTGKQNYRKMAENIVRNNLCLFSDDGRASCAYIYPYKVNGIKGKFYDPYANDQDWALVYYLRIFDKKENKNSK